MLVPMKLLTIVGATAVFITVTIFRGSVLKSLWAWFVVKQFGVEPIRIPAALGLALLVSFLTNIPGTRKDERPSLSVTMQLTVAFINSAAALLVGWIIHKFI